MLIITKGHGMALIGGKETELSEGEAIFIGPGISHEFWVDENAEHGAEGVLLMFGDGA
ncbi:MAG: AraC family ligand binding domain-containing protein [Planctomycetota bacterium]